MLSILCLRFSPWPFAITFYETDLKGFIRLEDVMLVSYNATSMGAWMLRLSFTPQLD
jgi:hypothetical protein